MTRHHKHDTLTEDSINILIEHGLAEGLPRIAEMLLNAAMIVERSAHLGAQPFERSDERTGYANGLKSRSFHSSIGPLDLKVPQTVSLRVKCTSNLRVKVHHFWDVQHHKNGSPAINQNTEAPRVERSSDSPRSGRQSTHGKALQF